LQLPQQLHNEMHMAIYLSVPKWQSKFHHSRNGPQHEGAGAVFKGIYSDIRILGIAMGVALALIGALIMFPARLLHNI
jgi:hypothetical protein